MVHVRVALLLAVAAFVIVDVNCLYDPELPSDLFYPFGEDVGDNVVLNIDDGYAGPIALPASFPFYNGYYGQIYVSNNGFISFGNQVTESNPIHFPISDTTKAMLAVYWADTDTSLNGGRTYCRLVTTDGALLARATQDAVNLTDATEYPLPASFNASSVVVTTWHNITYSGGSATSPVNSFQAVLVTDYYHSVVIYNYGNLTWSSGGNYSYDYSTVAPGSRDAQVGFNSGFSEFYYEVPSSQTPQIVSVSTTSNVGVPGRWVFRTENKTDAVTFTASLVTTATATTSTATVGTGSTTSSPVTTATMTTSATATTSTGSTTTTVIPTTTPSSSVNSTSTPVAAGTTSSSPAGNGYTTAATPPGTVTGTTSTSSPAAANNGTTVPTPTPATTRATYVTTQALDCSSTAGTPCFSNVTLSGPTVISRLWFEFYCTVQTNVTDTTARFNVTFLFDGNSVADVPVFTVTAASPTATLHEKYISGKLGTSLSCSAVSYFASTPAVASAPRASTGLPYYLGLHASTTNIDVTEGDVGPKHLLVKSTLPITCPDAATASTTPFGLCSIALTISVTNYVSMRQRYAGFDPLAFNCTYIFTENDWRPSEKLAYNSSAPLEIVAQIDPYVTAARLDSLFVTFNAASPKTSNGATYTHPWHGYRSPSVQAYHHDSNDATWTCTAVADPHYYSFDGLWYSKYDQGRFVYSRSTSGVPFEVQAAHVPCNNNYATCICAIAVREGDNILGIDACNQGIQLFTYHDGALPDGTGIYPAGSGYTIKTASSKIYCDVYTQWAPSYPPFINIRLVVTGKKQLEGICGSPDGDPSNELRVNGTDRYMQPEWGWMIPQEVSDSWRLQPGQSLFDGYLWPLPQSDTASDDQSTYCHRTGNDKTVCGGKAVGGKDLPGDPSGPPIKVPPSKKPNKKNSRRRRSTDTSSDTVEDVNDYYNPSRFTYSNDSFQPNLTWPTATGITHAQANMTCWSLIVSEQNLGPSCKGLTATDPKMAQDLVDLCVQDIQLTDNISWAYDKVASLQKSCYFAVLTVNRSHDSDPEQALEMAVADVQQVTDFACSPYDCSGHGNCSNGTCVCFAGYIGSGCAVSLSATPTIYNLYATKCDVRTRPCSSIDMQTQNAAGVPTLTCKIDVLLPDQSALTYNSSGDLTSTLSVRCSLPSEPLNYNSRVLNFTALHGPGYDFNSLQAGSPTMTYNVSLSNDGQHFGAARPLTVYDSLCMDCSTDNCVQKSSTCLVNGYCFNDQQLNPYDSSMSCQPTLSTSTFSSTTTTTTTTAATTTTSRGATTTAALLTAHVVLLSVVTTVLSTDQI